MRSNKEINVWKKLASFTSWDQANALTNIDLSIQQWKSRLKKNYIPQQSGAPLFIQFYEKLQSSPHELLEKFKALSEEDQKKALRTLAMWIATANKADVLRGDFQKLFDTSHPFNRSYYNDSPILLAAAFNANAVIDQCLQLKLFDAGDVRKALAVALSEKNLEKLSDLLQSAYKAGITIEMLNDYNFYNPNYDLYNLAIKTDYAEGFQFLINHRFSVDNPDYYFKLLAFYKNEKIESLITQIPVKTLPPLQRTYKDKPPLHSPDLVEEFKKGCRSIEVIKAWLDYDPTAINRFFQLYDRDKCYLPLECGLKTGASTPIIKLLLEYGALLDDKSLLHAINGRYDTESSVIRVLSFLIKSGAGKDPFVLTQALSDARTKHFYQVEEFLLALKIKPDAAYYKKSEHEIEKAIKDSNLERVRGLIQAGNQHRCLISLFSYYKDRRIVKDNWNNETIDAFIIDELKNTFATSIPDSYHVTQSAIAQLLLANPTQEMHVEIQQYAEQIRSQLRPYIISILVNNNREGLMGLAQSNLFDIDPSGKHPLNHALEDASIMLLATAFHAYDVILEGAKLGIFNQADIDLAFKVAEVTKDNELITGLPKIQLTHPKGGKRVATASNSQTWMRFMGSTVNTADDEPIESNTKRPKPL